MKKKDRSFYDFSFDKDQEIPLVRCNDNSVVIMASNTCSIELLVAAKRYDRKEKRKLRFLSQNLLPSTTSTWEELISTITAFKTTGFM